jgi:hypothetical protein
MRTYEPVVGVTSEEKLSTLVPEWALAENHYIVLDSQPSVLTLKYINI